jgi:hypothetical protein
VLRPLPPAARAPARIAGRAKGGRGGARGPPPPRRAGMWSGARVARPSRALGAWRAGGGAGRPSARGRDGAAQPGLRAGARSLSVKASPSGAPLARRARRARRRDSLPHAGARPVRPRSLFAAGPPAAPPRRLPCAATLLISPPQRAAGRRGPSAPLDLPGDSCTCALCKTRLRPGAWAAGAARKERRRRRRASGGPLGDACMESDCAPARSPGWAAPSRPRAEGRPAPPPARHAPSAREGRATRAPDHIPARRGGGGPLAPPRPPFARPAMRAGARAAGGRGRSTGRGHRRAPRRAHVECKIAPEPARNAAAHPAPRRRGLGRPHQVQAPVKRRPADRPGTI